MASSTDASAVTAVPTLGVKVATSWLDPGTTASKPLPLPPAPKGKVAWLSKTAGATSQTLRVSVSPPGDSVTVTLRYSMSEDGLSL